MTHHSLFNDFDLSRCSSNYGEHMLLSSLADLLELQVLRGVRLPWKSMAEGMREAGVSARVIDDAYVDNDYIEGELESNAFLDLEEDSYGQMTEQPNETVRSLIGFRMRYLGDWYPFSFDSFGQLTVDSNSLARSCSYCDLLLISLCAGWGYDQPSGKTLGRIASSLFENIVALALKNAGLNAFVMGTSQNGSFEEKLNQCGTELDLAASIRTIKPPERAKDEGVDVIGGFLWRDRRIGEPVWLIQATCGKSDWKEKLRGIDNKKWASYLSTRTGALALLAVPFHLTDEVIDRLVPHEGAFAFMDRLRLVKMLGSSIRYPSDELEEASRSFECDARELLGIPG